MLKILVLENGECLLDKRVPDEFGDIGCVFLLQETFIATLAHGGSMECGTFRVKMVDTNSDSGEDSFAEISDSNQTEQSESDTVDGAFVTRLITDETSFDADGDVTRVIDESSLQSSVSLEVYARIPGYDIRALIGRGGMGMV